jgi:S-adenosylmethionine synthetase
MKTATEIINQAIARAPQIEKRIIASALRPLLLVFEHNKVPFQLDSEYTVNKTIKSSMILNGHKFELESTSDTDSVDISDAEMLISYPSSTINEYFAAQSLYLRTLKPIKLGRSATLQYSYANTINSNVYVNIGDDDYAISVYVTNSGFSVSMPFRDDVHVHTDNKLWSLVDIAKSNEFKASLKAIVDGKRQEFEESIKSYTDTQRAINKL